MKRKILSFLILCFSVLFFMACTNLLDAEKRTSAETAIKLALPYANNSTPGVYRAGQEDADRLALKFKIIFKSEAEDEQRFEGKSGETILCENVVVGTYTIYVEGYDEADILQYEGNTQAEVKEGETTSVVIKLKRVKNAQEEPSDGRKDDETEENVEKEPELVEIKLLGHTDEQAKMIDKYIKEHPKCGIKVIFKEVETTNGAYTTYLDNALSGKSDEFVPDIYTAEAAFVKRYASGQMSSYALPYKNFISDLDAKLQAAQIAQYTIDIGKNSAGDSVGLAYQTTGGAFIYRRSIAKEIFGSDDPSLVGAVLGGGSGSWNKFWQAAEECGNKGIAILSGSEDLWHPVEGSAEKGWLVDGQLYIDPKREAFLDYAKNLFDKGWSNKTTQWSPEWYDDARGKGEKPVLGFFGPAWLINYTLEPACNTDDAGNVINDDRDWAVCDSPVGFSWGGTWMLANKKLADDSSEEGKRKLEAVAELLEWITLDTTEEGLQYQWANGLMDNAADTVSSKLVMEKSDGKVNFLNGQNMYDYYIPANNKASAKLLTEHDEKITQLWIFEVNKYARGLATRDQALNNFRYAVYSQLGIKWDGMNSMDYAYETEHVRAEPDPDGKGVKITISAKAGEEWKNDWYRITEKGTGMYINISGNEVPAPGKPVVFHWPFTEDGEFYAFDCDIKLKGDTDSSFTESVYSLAKGSYAKVNVSSDAFTGFKPQIKNLENAKVTFTKDIRSAMSFSSNVTPVYDFGTFTTADAEKYTWKEWVNTVTPEVNDARLYAGGQGIEAFNLDIDVARKLTRDKYFFIDVNMEFKVDGLSERYRYKDGFQSAIYDASAMIENHSDNKHISVEPCSEGIKVTVRHLEGEAEWKSGNSIVCLTGDWKDGVVIHLELAGDYGAEGLPSELSDNEAPSADDAERTYIFPFTQAGKKYNFALTGPLDKEGAWLTEYVCCSAGGGLGELIDAEAWNEDIKVTDVDYANRSFKISGPVEDLIDNSENLFSSAYLWIDVRPGTRETYNGEKFGYASRPVCIIGDASASGIRSLSDLNGPLLIENDPNLGQLDPDDFNNRDVLSILAEHDNKFWVTMSVMRIHLQNRPSMEYALSWK